MQPADWHSIETDEALQRLGASATGLTTADAQQRLAGHGPNAIPEKRRRSLMGMLLWQLAECGELLL
jgi:Ca2+-transporting ATPase